MERNKNGFLLIRDYERHRRNYIYCPDFVAKKNGEIYIIEVKTNTGRLDNEKEREGLELAKDYGFTLMLVKLKLSINLTNFTTEIL